MFAEVPFPSGILGIEFTFFVLVPVSDRREEKKYNSAALDFAGIEIED